LDQATKMAYSMISVFGMNDKVGNVSFHGMQQNQFSKPYSDATATLIDDEVRKMLESQYQRAQDLLKDKRNELEILANELLAKEVLHKSDLIKLIGPRPADEKAKAEKLAEEEEKKNTPFTEEPGTSATDAPDDAPVVE